MQNTHTFTNIVNDLQTKGFSVQDAVVPEHVAAGLLEELGTLDFGVFDLASIGKGTARATDTTERRDRVHWIEDESTYCRAWLEWMHELQHSLNRTLFLGLFSFESHFSNYPPGAFYKKHIDAFQGPTNRVLSVVTYLNTDWSAKDGGELLIYNTTGDKTVAKVQPAYRTLVVFMSEEFPHEVLPAKQSRYSVAGWFCVNGSTTHRVDPPS